VEPGFYAAEIVDETEVKPSANGKGSGYKLLIQLYDNNLQPLGLVSDYYALTHQNGEYLARCENKLRRIGEVIGIPQISDTKQLYLRKFAVRVDVRNIISASGETIQINTVADKSYATEIQPINYLANVPAPVPQSVAAPVSSPILPRRSKPADVPNVHKNSDDTPF
jgi:hypothetical protein